MAERAVRGAWLYRWLTAAPGHGVVVVDLRESVFLGPGFALLDRLLNPLARRVAGTRIGRSLAALSERFDERPVGVLSTVALVVLLTNLAALVGFGSPSASEIGSELLAVSLALAGTRIETLAKDLRETRASERATAGLSPPQSKQNDGGGPSE